jgi:hypothetical protein
LRMSSLIPQMNSDISLWFSINSISIYIRLKYKFNLIISVIIILKSVYKNGSVGFSESLASSVMAKADVPIVRLQVLFILLWLWVVLHLFESMG